MMILPIVMQRDTVELFEWINKLSARCREITVKRNAFQYADATSTANINALALLDISEIDRVNAAALVWDHRWLHVTDESPLSSTEKGVALDV
jgi:hypothetical protein